MFNKAPRPNARQSDRRHVADCLFESMEPRVLMSADALPTPSSFTVDSRPEIGWIVQEMSPIELTNNADSPATTASVPADYDGDGMTDIPTTVAQPTVGKLGFVMADGSVRFIRDLSPQQQASLSQLQQSILPYMEQENLFDASTKTSASAIITVTSPQGQQQLIDALKSTCGEMSASDRAFVDGLSPKNIIGILIA